MALIEINDSDGCLIYQALQQLSQDCAREARKSDLLSESAAFQRSADRWDDLAFRFNAALDKSDANPGKVVTV
jgi:hypothetical protein